MPHSRIMIAGTGSGCGKTTLTCAILQALADRGIKTAAFKCGPDYIDPMFHSQIIGASCRNLDGWLCGDDTLNYLLYKNSGEISVIEGVMGFYDGVDGKGSSFQLSECTNTPVVLVIDCKGLGLSIGAVMKGYLSFREPNNIVGFIFNRLPESLVPMAKTLCTEMGVSYLGRLPYAADCSISSRHLGLVTAGEVENLKKKMKKLALLAEENIELDSIIRLAKHVNDLSFTPYFVSKITDKRTKIAVARDKAFCFYYDDSLDLLKELGCELIEFSPLSDTSLPEDVSGLILGGGYPELYADKLAENRSLRIEIRTAVLSGMPTVAECGGFMYLHESLESADGAFYPMAGVFPGKAYNAGKLQRFGYMRLTAREDGLLCKKGESLGAHEFHYWNSVCAGEDFNGVKASNGSKFVCCHSSPSLYAGFPHLCFYSDINIAKRFVRKCEEYMNGQN